MLTHQEPIMQHNRMKAADPSASSQESLYRLLMQQQQQQQHESASFRGLGARGLANFTGNFSMNPSSLGLGSFALPNYPSLNTTTPSSLALSRQQLLQSLIAAEEREMYQRRLALEGRLALQQQMNFSSPPPPQQSFMPSMIPPSQDFTNVQVDPEANFGRKRSFEETAYEKPEFALGQLPEVKKEAPPASVSTPTEPTRAESTPQVIEPSVKSAPAISRKPAPKKKNSKKSPKRSDSSVASEPKKDTKWLNMLEELKTYKAKYGNCIVPRGYSPNPRLASWVAEQR